MDTKRIRLTEKERELSRSIFARAAADAIATGAGWDDFERIARSSIEAATAFKKVDNERRTSSALTR